MPRTACKELRDVARLAFGFDELATLHYGEKIELGLGEGAYLKTHVPFLNPAGTSS